MASPKLNEKLFVAIAAGQLPEVQKLIDQGANLEAQDGNDQTPLARAAWGGHVEIFELLAESGADLKASMIFWNAGVCVHGNEDSALKILRRVVEAIDLSSEKPRLNYMLIRSIEDRSPRYIRELLRLGADPNWKEEDGENPLAKAVWFQRTEVDPVVWTKNKRSFATLLPVFLTDNFGLLLLPRRVSVISFHAG